MSAKYLRIEALAIPALQDLGFKDSHFDYQKSNISETLIRNYQETRNLPSVAGTSQISVQLRFGTISIRDLVKLAVQWNEQLNETGLMHNRVRMITAGFLCKHLLIDWRWGEAYFAQKLLDFELSSNNGNWQWAAGSGKRL